MSSCRWQNERKEGPRRQLEAPRRRQQWREKKGGGGHEDLDDGGEGKGEDIVVVCVDCRQERRNTILGLRARWWRCLLVDERERERKGRGEPRQRWEEGRRGRGGGAHGLRLQEHHYLLQWNAQNSSFSFLYLLLLVLFYLSPALTDIKKNGFLFSFFSFLFIIYPSFLATSAISNMLLTILTLKKVRSSIFLPVFLFCSSFFWTCLPAMLFWKASIPDHIFVRICLCINLLEKIDKLNFVIYLYFMETKFIPFFFGYFWAYMYNTKQWWGQLRGLKGLKDG